MTDNAREKIDNINNGIETRAKLKVAIPIKIVFNSSIHPQINDSNLDLDYNINKFEINPFDEVAIEAAKNLRVQCTSLEVEIIGIYVWINQHIHQHTIEEVARIAFARGCNRVIVINALMLHDMKAKIANSSLNIQSSTIAKLITQIIRQENVELVLMGKMSSDEEYAELPAKLIVDLNSNDRVKQFGFITNAVAINREHGYLNWHNRLMTQKQIHQNDNNQIEDEVSNINSDAIKDLYLTCDAEINQKKYFYAIVLPHLITVDLSIAKLSFIKLPQLVMARKKIIEYQDASSIIDIDNVAQNQQGFALLSNLWHNSQSRKCLFMQNVEELAKELVAIK